MSLQNPEPFGKYYLLEKIAEGGMAEIFKAKAFSHGGFEKLLVIKRILGHLSSDADFVDMFVDEAKISVTLTHPNIVQIFDFGRIRDNYFITMECVEGKDLRGLLARLEQHDTLLPVEFSVHIAREACAGLDYAHKKTDAQGKPLGIVHRDVSPSNILLSYAGEVKVADFGIARAETGAHQTRAGNIKGKVEYMSPEQASASPLDARSDVFAMGIVLYEMLTGHKPFGGDSDFETMESVRTAPVGPPSALNPAVSPALDAVVARALAKDPNDRYPDCQAMRSDLTKLMPPGGADEVRAALGQAMAQFFEAERTAEADSLAKASTMAAKMWEMPAEVPVVAPTTQVTQAQAQAPAPQLPPRSRSPVAMGAGVAAVLVVLGAVFALVRGRPDAVPVCPPDRGCLAVTVSAEEGAPLPSGLLPQVLLDGKPVGSGVVVEYDQITPGAESLVRVQADGYYPAELPWTFRPGERRKFDVLLRRMGPEAQASTTAGGAAGAVAATLRFSSEPRGAEVFVDGRSIGRTPIDWDAGTPQRTHAVRFAHADALPLTTPVVFPAHGVTTVHERLTPTGAAASLRVDCPVGTAQVVVDGVAVAPPGQVFAVAPGVREVALVGSDGVAVDRVRVQVAAGQALALGMRCG